MADPFPLAGPSITPADVLTALGLATAMQLPQQPKPVPPAAGNPSLLNEILGRNGSTGPAVPSTTYERDPPTPPFDLPPPPPAFPPGAQGIAPTPAPPIAPNPRQVPPAILAPPGLPTRNPPPADISNMPQVPIPAALPAELLTGPTGTSGLAPAVEPLGPVFPGGSLLQNLGIPLPTTSALPQGRGSGGAAPSSPQPSGASPSLPPGAQPIGPTGPVTAPEPAGGSSGGARSSSDSGRGASRLMDTLAVIGTVLSQPPPPGGNLVSQIGRAMGMGFMYNKMLDSAEVEQINTGKKQELESRRAAVAEKQVGIQDKRAGFDERRVAIDEAKAPVEIEYLRSRAQAAGLGAKLQEIELKYKNDPVRRDLEMRKLQAEVDNIGARTDLTRNQVETPQSQAQAREAKALKDAGALDPMSPTGINWRVAGPVLAGMGYRTLGAADVQAAKAKYQDLIKAGVKPFEAEHQLNMYLRSKRYVPISLAPDSR